MRTFFVFEPIHHLSRFAEERLNSERHILLDAYMSRFINDRSLHTLLSINKHALLHFSLIFSNLYVFSIFMKIPEEFRSLPLTLSTTVLCTLYYP